MSAGLLLFQLALVACESSDAPTLDRVDFAARFKGFDGCFVIQPVDGAWTLRHNDRRCAEPLSPCSTFKIFIALAALESGVIEGPDTKLQWDGKPKPIKAWEKDHTLATAIRDSVVWYFQEVAGRIGEKRMQQFLDAVKYGNRDMSGGLKTFWLQTSLKISADEQVRFLARLYRNQLPFSQRAMDEVKKMLVLDKGKNWTFSGKTGTGSSDGKLTLGWFVGCVKSHEREYVFAINIAAPDGALGRGAKEIAKAILKDLGLLD